MERIIMDEAYDNALEVVGDRIKYLKEEHNDSLLIEVLITELENVQADISKLKYYKGGMIK